MTNLVLPNHPEIAASLETKQFRIAVRDKLFEANLLAGEAGKKNWSFTIPPVDEFESNVTMLNKTAANQ